MKTFKYSFCDTNRIGFYPKGSKVSSSASDDVIVRVKYAALNPIDYKLPYIPLIGQMACLSKKGIGMEFCGDVVKAAGPFKVGDCVFGAAKSGSLSEYCTARVSEIALKPAGMSEQAATCLPVCYLT